MNQIENETWREQNGVRKSRRKRKRKVGWRMGSFRSFLSMHWGHEPALWHRLRGAGVIDAPPEVSASLRPLATFYQPFGLKKGELRFGYLGGALCCAPAITLRAFSLGAIAELTQIFAWSIRPC